jgi:hypothetical protein
VRLLLAGGQALFGEPGLLGPLSPGAATLTVDGHARALDGPIARRAAAILGAHAVVRALPWTAGLDLSA